MTGREKIAIKVAAERIKDLAKMEYTSLFNSSKSSMPMEKKVLCYKQCLESVAKGLEKLADAENNLEKESAIANLIRYCD